MFQTRGFIFRKTVVSTVMYVEDIKKLKFKILIKGLCISLVHIVQLYYNARRKKKSYIYFMTILKVSIYEISLVL